MTFEDLDRELPNGFHDAEIRNISMDFLVPSVLIGMGLLVGLPDTPNPDDYRAGTLRLVAPYLFFVEPPDARYPFVPSGKPVSASGASVKLGENPKVDALLGRIPAEATAFVFFLDDWNSYLYLAGASVEFSWDDGGVFAPVNSGGTGGHGEWQRLRRRKGRGRTPGRLLPEAALTNWQGGRHDI